MVLPEEQKDQWMLDSITNTIAAIQDILRVCSTESVVQRLLQEKGYPRPGFKSPAKQISFLLGLLLATEEPTEGRSFDGNDWKKTASLLEKLFDVYMERYMPDENQIKGQSVQQVQENLIPLLMFLDYFYKTILANPEELANRIASYVVPFDNQLERDWGISASDCLKITHGIINEVQSTMKHVAANANVMPSIEILLPYYRINRSKLLDQHGAAGDVFWQLFTVGRGEGDQLRYPTEKSVVERRPFIRLSDDIALLCDLREILITVLTQCEEVLSKGTSRRSYFRRRAKTTERQATHLFERMLGGAPRIYQNLFETPANQNEHDLIVVDNDLCLFIEVKSSPPREPRRNPENGLTQLRRSFRSDTGIQSAYNQALRVLKSVRKSKVTILYDRHGNEALRLPRRTRENTFCVCVTRDSFGPVRGHLSSLLDKERHDPYPWVVSVLELESMAEAWEHFRWGSKQLKAFLSFRLGLHGLLSGDDELDFVGAYILNCGLYKFNMTEGLLTTIDPTYAYIFDDIHDHLFRDAPARRFYPVLPLDSSANEFYRTGEPVLSRSLRQSRIRMRPNEQCRCGSGVKFKLCHGIL